MTLIICSCGNPQDYINMGNTKFDNKDYNGAIMDYTEALELDPECAVAFWVRGNAKHALQDLDGACEDWKRASVLDSGWKDEFEVNCQTKTPIQKVPIQEVPVQEVPNPEFTKAKIKMSGFIQRSSYFINSSQYKMDYIYRNDAAFGTNALMTYDKFFRKYDISFRTETGEVVNFKITDENFFNDWDFEYKGNTYVFSNSHIR
jgi:tetratricopeptide (TPR) repeat protein